MKYLIISILFVLSLGYAGYYLYMFDKKVGVVNDIRSKNDIANKTQMLPKHLTEAFWINMDTEQLKEKLKNIENVNKVRPDNKKSMLHLLVEHGRHPEMISLLIDAGADHTLKLKETNGGGKALHYAVVRKDKAYEFTKALLGYDKNINEKDIKFGATPLIWAVYFRAPASVIQLFYWIMKPMLMQ